MNRLAYNSAIEVISALVAPSGYECVEIEWEGPEETLRVFVDKDTGITMEDCLKVNSLLIDSSELDRHFPAEYRLEVSSPGLDRPLRTSEHFTRQVGKKISVQLDREVGGRVKGTGSLLEISADGSLTIELAQGPWIVPLEAIFSARLQYEW